MRLGTANTYDNTLLNLTTRQADLADLQEKLSAGKRVLRASDDPIGAAQAERAATRLARIDTDQRALNLQKNSITMAESTLGDATDALKAFRDLIISAGNGSYNSVDRTTIAQQMRGLRDQLFAYANKQDSNGTPLFGGLGSSPQPFTDPVTGVVFNGTPGQRASTAVSIPGTMDGQSTWMDVPTGNGVFTVGLGAGNTGSAWTSVGQVVSPAALTGHNYTVAFTSPTTYTVTDTTNPANPINGVAQSFASGQNIQFDGLAFQVNGTPAAGDTIQVAPSTRSDLFAVLDSAIASITGTNNSNVLSQNLAQALAQVDSGTNRIMAARGQAGELLNRADIIDSNQKTKSDQLTADRSRAEDMDMVKGISDFQTQQTGYDAALKTYAQVQKLSLFNYLG